MDQKEVASMTGQAREQGEVAYKLNEVRMNGDSGTFSMIELLGEKGADGKYAVKELGTGLEGVILKMRWRLFKYEGDGPTAKVTATSEFDNKMSDRVVIFGSGEKGTAITLKEKYALGSQRVLYVYLPGLKQVVRVIVKPSALSGDKNPAKELGLFEYVDLFNNEGLYLHEWTTKFGSAARKDPNGNKRKDYCAMTFAKGHEHRSYSFQELSMMAAVHGWALKKQAGGLYYIVGNNKIALENPFVGDDAIATDFTHDDAEDFLVSR